MNDKSFINNIDDETLAVMIDKTLNYKKNAKNRNITTHLLRMVPAAAAVALVIGLINLLPAVLNNADVPAGAAVFEINENYTEGSIDLFLPWVMEKTFFEEQILELITENRERDKISSYYRLKDGVYALDPKISNRESELILEYLAEYTDLTGGDIMQMLIANDLPLEHTKSTPSAEDLLFVTFDPIRQENTATNIGLKAMQIRFQGTFNAIDPDDFTDIALTRDGIVIENELTYYGRSERGSWYGDITDFYFEFADDNREPGCYSLAGKYKGADFECPVIIVEKYPVGDTPADPADLWSIGYAGATDGIQMGTMISLDEIALSFRGVQEAFYQSDLTDLKLTLNGTEIEFKFLERVVRYLEGDDAKIWEGTGENDYIIIRTSFHLILDTPLDIPGTYQLTGNYKSVPFESPLIIIGEYMETN